MSFTSWIIDRLNQGSGYFYDIYLEVYDWPWPFYTASWFFYQLSVIFADLAWDFWSMDSWFQSVQARLDAIVIPTLDDFLALLEQVVPAGLVDWFYSRYSWFADQIGAWWVGMSSTVHNWIDAVYFWADGWINYLDGEITAIKALIAAGMGDLPNLTELMAWFSNWSGNVWGLIDDWWSDQIYIVQEMILAAFIERESLWAGWIDFKAQVADFFRDPDDWLYRAVDRIFERFW